jgi:hypothetical protein
MLKCRFQIDVSSIILPEWNFVIAQPKTLNDTISDYVNSDKTIKLLQIHAKVEWDWKNLKLALQKLVIRCT